jgi:hypothetical protein
MKPATKLRWIGFGILLFNLWRIGNFGISGFPVLLLTFGFAAVFEIMVRTVAGKEG